MFERIVPSKLTEKLKEKYDSVYDHHVCGFQYSKTRINVVLNDKHGLVDYLGNEIVPLIYDEICGFLNGFFQVELNNKFGFIDSNGNIVCEIKYDYIEFGNSDNILLVRIGDKFGFIDDNFKEICEIKYDDSDGFANGLGKVLLNNKWFYIDKNGQEIKEHMI